MHRIKQLEAVKRASDCSRWACLKSHYLIKERQDYSQYSIAKINTVKYYCPGEASTSLPYGAIHHIVVVCYTPDRHG